MESAVKPEWRRQFGMRLRKARKAQGWTQEHLAEVVGLHPTYIGDAERGERNVSLENILKLAKGLKIAPGYLLDGLEKHIKPRN